MAANQEARTPAQRHRLADALDPVPGSPRLRGSARHGGSRCRVTPPCLTMQSLLPPPRRRAAASVAGDSAAWRGLARRGINAAVPRGATGTATGTATGSAEAADRLRAARPQQFARGCLGMPRMPAEPATPGDAQSMAGKSRCTLIGYSSRRPVLDWVSESVPEILSSRRGPVHGHWAAAGIVVGWPGQCPVVEAQVAASCGELSMECVASWRERGRGSSWLEQKAQGVRGRHAESASSCSGIPRMTNH